MPFLQQYVIIRGRWYTVYQKKNKKKLLYITQSPIGALCLSTHKHNGKSGIDNRGELR